MPIDVKNVLTPGHSAVITCEMQRGIIGDLSGGGPLATECADLRITDAAANLVRAARASRVPVVHALTEHRADGAARLTNTPLLAIQAKSPSTIVQGTAGAELVPALGPEPTDVLCRRIHGLTPFTSTDLDQVLRNVGVTTIVPVGVSLNVSLLGLCLTGASLGYRIALPTDAVAGYPREFSQTLLEHAFRMLATLTTTDAVIAAWTSVGPG